MTPPNKGETISEVFFDDSRFTNSHLLRDFIAELEANTNIAVMSVHEEEHDFEEQNNGPTKIKKITLTDQRGLPVNFKVEYMQYGEEI
jgi:hypothetical protein